MNKILRASRVGHCCDRHLWYSMMQAQEETSDKTALVFEIGRTLEPVVIQHLRNNGYSVKRNPLDGSNEGLNLKIDVEGDSISAHPDCIITDEVEGNILVDIKTMNDHSFRVLKREGTKKAFPQYFAQVHIYAEALKRMNVQISKLGIVALNKNNAEVLIDTFDFEAEAMKAIIERAKYIFSCQEAPEQGSRFEEWKCSYCGYASLCELCKSKKDSSVGDENIPVTENQEVIDAIELLKESRELEKAGKELADDAKAVLEREVRSQGIKSIRHGSLILILNEVKSSRLDTAALKKAHPDIAQEFMKQSSSVRYDLKEVA